MSSAAQPSWSRWRPLKLTMVALLTCLIFLVGSFNVTLRHILVQHRRHKQQEQPGQPHHQQNQQVANFEVTVDAPHLFQKPLDDLDWSVWPSHRRQSDYRSTPTSNSAQLAAEAHFVKAMQMLLDVPTQPEPRTATPTNKAHRPGLLAVIVDHIVQLYWKALEHIYASWLPPLRYSHSRHQLGNSHQHTQSLTRAPTTHTSNLLNRVMPFYEEDDFSWRDTQVGRALAITYKKILDLWSRRNHKYSSIRTPYQNMDNGRNKTTIPQTNNALLLLSKEETLAFEGLNHLEKAAYLGHAEAQRMLANSLASGILPLSDHSLLTNIQTKLHNNHSHSLTSLLQPLQVPNDFSSGDKQLSHAIFLWHLSAMDGNVESAMALGYRHLYSATGGGATVNKLLLDSILSPFDTQSPPSTQILAPGYHPSTGGPTHIHGNTPTSHYGVLGICPTALAYYQAAANNLMDTLESHHTVKIPPPIDEHRLSEIHHHGGASSALEPHNKPDELEEALQYYRLLASRKRHPEPDLVAAYTLANFYYLGLRGVKQDLRLARKYFEICGDYQHWEGGGLAGLMHVWGVGMLPDERDLERAYRYFEQGTPGGLEGCIDRKKKKKKSQRNEDDSDDIKPCDGNSANGMGLISLLGIDGIIDRNVGNALRWFEIAKDLDNTDGQYNYAMMRLGWMVSEPKETVPSNASIAEEKERQGENNKDVTPSLESFHEKYTGPSVSDYTVAVQELSRAASKGHMQAKHRLAMLYATGVTVPKKKGGSPIQAVSKSCLKALKFYKSIADSGYTVSQRNRAAWKQYTAGEYEAALRNYLAAAETGSVVGQLNAAFLLERGHCLGMTMDDCTRASIRLLRAAARQGSLDATLRVGDFYYYGRMKKWRTTDDNQRKGQFLFVSGPYEWIHYIIYPERLLDVLLESFHKWMIIFRKSVSNLYLNWAMFEPTIDEPVKDMCSSDEKVCSVPRGVNEEDKETIPNNEEEEDHMAIAAQYYRKAAEDYKSARANYNLGFMYEWGLGLTQDFPLAKRHYDLMGEESKLAAFLALSAMSIHEKMMKLGLYWKDKRNV